MGDGPVQLQSIQEGALLDTAACMLHKNYMSYHIILIVETARIEQS
jgi:hypothetical protein